MLSCVQFNYTMSAKERKIWPLHPDHKERLSLLRRPTSFRFNWPAADHQNGHHPFIDCTLSGTAFSHAILESLICFVVKTPKSEHGSTIWHRNEYFNITTCDAVASEVLRDHPSRPVMTKQYFTMTTCSDALAAFGSKQPVPPRYALVATDLNVGAEVRNALKDEITVVWKSHESDSGIHLIPIVASVDQFGGENDMLKGLETRLIIGQDFEEVTNVTAVKLD